RLTRTPELPTTGTVSTKDRQTSSAPDGLEDNAAPHQILAASFDGDIAHRRLAMIATPTSGIRTPKNGGGRRRVRGNSRRNPSALTSMMAAGSLLTRASNRGTAFRGERRTDLSSMRAIETKQDSTANSIGLVRYIACPSIAVARRSVASPMRMAGAVVLHPRSGVWNALLTAQLASAMIRLNGRVRISLAAA